jgi:hypothetical protein
MVEHPLLDNVALWLELSRKLWRERAARVDGPERALALTLRRLREAVAEAIGRAECCAVCVPAGGRRRRRGAAPRPPSGGFCCGGPPGVVFGDAELAALALGGTRPWHLVPAAGLVRGTGCIFLGDRGCSLAPAHRPNICVAHLCVDLKRELAGRGALDRVDALCEEIRRCLLGYQEARRRRVDREWIESLT